MGRPRVPFDQKYIPVTETGCWLWIGCWESTKYGTTGSKPRGAHRLSWLLHRGPIPPGMYVCHKCDTPPCVNPDHLFLGTNQDNQLDYVRKGFHSERPHTHCSRGHAFDAHNTLTYASGKRYCRECGRIRARAQHERKKQMRAVK